MDEVEVTPNLSNNPLLRGLEEHWNPKVDAARKAKQTESLEKAKATYNEHKTHIANLLDGIKKGMAHHGKGETINWGHVGDLAEHRSTLQRVHDSLWKKGEYAESPTPEATSVHY